MTTMIVLFSAWAILFSVWAICSFFNLWKIHQSSQGADVLETLFAITLSPLYTLLALIAIFIIKPWN